MTVVPYLRAIFAPADETVAELDRLNAAGAARQASHRDQLRNIVARLDQGAPPEEPETPIERRQRDDDRRPPVQEPTTFVRLPERTTRGGGFGPAVRDRLVREALSKRGW